METSPIIQPVIIDQYNKKYGNEKAKKPSIVNGLKSVVVNDEVVLTGSNNSPIDNTANPLKTPTINKTNINISEDNYINQLNAHS
jgi:hypothetical protein